MANLSNVVSPSGVITSDNTATLSNKTLVNPTVTGYTETIFTSSGSAFTINLTNGSVQKLTTTANTTITLPASSTGKSFIIMVVYGGAHTITFAGGTSLVWADNTAPTPTSTLNKTDIFSFFQDGTKTYATIFGQNFS